jgi:hypothetical protein
MMTDTSDKIDRLRKLTDGSAEIKAHPAIDPDSDLFFAISRVSLDSEFQIGPGVLQSVCTFVWAIFGREFVSEITPRLSDRIRDGQAAG